MPACLVAAVVCATTPALFAGQSDAEKAHSSFMTGGGMFIVDTDVYAVGTIVGTKTHHRERTKFATLRLSPVKTLCLYVRISNFEVDGLKAAFDAQGRCTTPKSEFLSKYRFTVADGGTWAKDRLTSKRLSGGESSMNPFGQGAPADPDMGTFMVNEGGSAPRITQSKTAPYVVGGAYMYGPPGSIYFIVADLQGAARKLEVIKDERTRYTHCKYTEISRFGVGGSQLHGYRATFDATGTCEVLSTSSGGRTVDAWDAHQRFTIVDRAGGVGRTDTVQIVDVGTNPGAPKRFPPPSQKIEAGNFTARPS